MLFADVRIISRASRSAVSHALFFAVNCPRTRSAIPSREAVGPAARTIRLLTELSTGNHQPFPGNPASVLLLQADSEPSVFFSRCLFRFVGAHGVRPPPW